ncbi:hypothetical protein T440DRAFT_420845 [Plenodomus tracheiphilus IPT5]|uniref:RBR-type E3 ubiquitin transferase n=1 Tax=Plenodomus tracheiphilus IPT5 TaxID=1408161 RepID=A0A6A7B9Q6_9PLEO|nr:hypothetical protein T440DRAFT_420845 [Plenodomus tracheiphilus IPT5]
MARDRDERGTRYVDDHHREEERRHRRRHKSRDHDDEARRERRERRRAEEARRQAEIDIDDLRARRESYYSRPESDRRGERMAQERRMDSAKEKSRSSQREPRRDGTRRVKRKEAVVDDRSDDFVYGRPKSRGVVEEVTVRRSSTRKRSEEGGSSRTAYSPRSGSGSTSGRRVDVQKLSRSTSAREPSRGFLSSRPSVRRTGTMKTPPPPAAVTRTQSVKEPARKSGILSSFFRPPQSRTPVAVAHKEVPRVDCLVCMNDDLPINKTVKLACGHRMCHSCLRRQFTLSVQDPQHMPPRCCTTEHIPLKYAERLFDDKFKILWNKKYQEYTTANRLYCPAKGCGQWIKPSKIRMDMTYGRKYARCASCQTKVCVLCNSKFHTRKECPKDEETNRLVEMAKEKGWQRCYSCKAVVELKEGCNHMTCRCTAQFCMVCAAPWKTCNCPWFNYQHIEDDDRLNDARIPYPANHDVVEVIEFPEEPSPPLARRSSTRTRHRSERSRDVDRPDQVLAAHLQSQMRLEPRPTVSEVRRSDPIGHVYGLGNAGGHHMNESYAVRSTPALAPRTSSRQSAPRTSFFGRRVQAPAPARPSAQATASAMAGLSRDGKKIGANRVGTWLTHIQVDAEAINTAPRGVEVDDWRCDGTMIGID